MISYNYPGSRGRKVHIRAILVKNPSRWILEMYSYDDWTFIPAYSSGIIRPHKTSMPAVNSSMDAVECLVRNANKWFQFVK